MDKKHSVREFYYSRVLGTKRRKSPSSLLEVQVGESVSCPGFPWVIITVRKSNGPALRLSLIGHEAQDLGNALITLGAKLSALQEEDRLCVIQRVNLVSQWYPKVHFVVIAGR